jgi:glutathione S-transferase
MSQSSQPTIVLCELTDAASHGLESFSPFCLKVHRALRTAGLAYTRRHLGRPSETTPMNPTGQVPVLLVDGKPTPDSTRILARIEELAGPLGGAGRDARSVAEAWLWEDFADSALYPYVVASRWADDRNWPGVAAVYFKSTPWLVRKLVMPRIRARVIGSLVARDVWRAGADECWARLLRTLDQLEARAPSTGFWLDDRVSVADIALFAQLQSLRTSLTAWQAHALESHPALTAWLDRVDAATRAGGQALRSGGSFAAAA